MVVANAAQRSSWEGIKKSAFYLVLLLLLVAAAVILWLYRSQSMAERLSALAIGAFAAVAFLVELFVCLSDEHHPIASAFSMLSGIISVFLFLGGAAFGFWYKPIPLIAFVILVVLFCFTVINYFLYVKWDWGLPRLGTWNFLKGLGGTTFAEFAGSVGVLVAIGIYVVYRSEQASLWWAAQLSALISLISAAPWVQRYALEEPTYPVWVTENWISGEHQKLWRFLKTGPNWLNSIAALATMLAVMLPTQSPILSPTGEQTGEMTGNYTGMIKALSDYWWVVFMLWGVVLLLWIVLAFFPTFFDISKWRTNPAGHEAHWSNRNITFFSATLLFFLMASAVLLGWACYWTSRATEASQGWAEWSVQWPATIAAGLFVGGIVWRWLVDQYEEERGSELKMLMIFRDMVFFACGVVIFIVQIRPLGDAASPWSSAYQFILGMMGYATIAGMLVGGYKWSSKTRSAEISKESNIRRFVPLGHVSFDPED